ncbi:hypothetical protein HDU82_002010 [Entophlyctis luteolus]|nr:hypothetical protein HDU82_002010 [Entophlyctis luteolus]
MDADAFLRTALAAARLAGPVVASAFRDRALQGTHQLKTSAADIVTATDKAVEALVIDFIRSKHPSHGFIGEESYASATGSNSIPLTPTWIIDPVDGTTNFAHGFPYICISIALAVDGVPVVGVVHNPVLGETYYATVGGGAYVIEGFADSDAARPLPVHPPRPFEGLSHALVATEFGYDRDARLEAKLSSLTRILGAPTRGVRALGSAALNACYVARGAFDVYWEAGVHVWDVAAAAVIVQESGGVVANFDSADGVAAVDWFQRKFVFVRGMEGGRKEAEAVAQLIRSKLDPLTYDRD